MELIEQGPLAAWKERRERWRGEEGEVKGRRGSEMWEIGRVEYAGVACESVEVEGSTMTCGKDDPSDVVG